MDIKLEEIHKNLKERIKSLIQNYLDMSQVL
jgi:hypothetical protein